MSATETALIVSLVSYCIGAIPVGYLVGRWRGVNLFQVGSGNIGATNVGRNLGMKYGALVFILDFCKGATPVIVTRILSPNLSDAAFPASTWQVIAAMSVFLGNLFPITLGFRGGKGVATGAGAVAVLVPGPFLFALITWLTIFVCTRYVSLASIGCVIALVTARLIFTVDAIDNSGWILTVFLVTSSGFVILKHRGNIYRLIKGSENRFLDHPKYRFGQRALHLIAIAWWFGAAAFFNFIAATPIFDSFKDVVANQPSDRTAYQQIQAPNASDTEKAALASALAGSAVGPLFPRYFTLAGVCAWVVLLTSWCWKNGQYAPRISQWRFRFSVVAFIIVLVSWPISQWVSELRVERFHPAVTIADKAKSLFVPVHLASLFLSAILTCIAGAILVLATKMPPEELSATSPNQIPSE